MNSSVGSASCCATQVGSGLAFARLPALRPALRGAQPGRQVRLERLADGGHVISPEKVAFDQPVEPMAGVDLLGRLRAGDDIGGELDLRALDRADPDLDEPGGVGEQELYASVGLWPPVAALAGERAHLVALVVEKP